MSWMRAAVVALVVAAALVHSAWLVRLPVWGQVPDPLLPLVMAVAFRKPEWGPITGVGAGFLQDLLFGGSLGLFALPKLLVGQGAAIVARTVLIEQPLLPWAATAAATILHQVILWIVLLLGGLLPVSIGDLGKPLLKQIVLNVLIAWPVFALAGFILRPRQRRPVRRELIGGI